MGYTGFAGFEGLPVGGLGGRRAHGYAEEIGSGAVRGAETGTNSGTNFRRPMRDPHVHALTYGLMTLEAVMFENPPPVEWETEAFHLRLEDGSARVEMIEHFATEEEARARVEPFLRTWEIEYGLWAGESEFWFVFQRAELIDRDPPPRPTGGGPVQLEGHDAGVSSEEASLTVRETRHSYHGPPQDFVVTPDVETLWNRWEGYLGGREPLQSTAYFCLTVIEAQAGGGKRRREKAARVLSLEPRVLDTLGHLTSDVGDDLSARKFNPAGRPLSGQEEAWVEAAVRMVIRRLGQLAADPARPLPILGMSDLPDLGT
jgi:hypothetical protein